MSHHLDSPLARQDPRLNITDQYVFDVDDATVLVMNVRTSLAGADSPAGFHPEGRYEFKIHQGDADRESLTFRVTFDPEAADGEQTYRLDRLDGDDAGRDDATGTTLVEGRTGQAIDGPDGLRVWAGRAAEPFYLDLRLLGAVDQAVQHGQDVPITGYSAAENTFAGAAVDSIVLQLPHTDSVVALGRDLRVWSVAKLATDAGGWRQINRAGLPMMWPIFRDAESDVASEADQTHPADDRVNYAKTITDLIAGVVARRGTSSRPDAYAAAVTDRLTPDTLPYRVGTPAVFGFAGFNGRHLADNAPEVMFSLVTNSAVTTGLTADQTAATRSETFPYVVPSATPR
ncbi:DUF4331 family protein [Cryptosporangium arvum]|uniref:DUF4331 family protein n=1 Tax=Cryptosporangium arvum TaxID=80871 RepID=UPI0004B35C4F|nr:DUF4331 family protein [Cryptosporangium arvum]